MVVRFAGPGSSIFGILLLDLAVRSIVHTDGHGNVRGRKSNSGRLEEFTSLCLLGDVPRRSLRFSGGRSLDLRAFALSGEIVLTVSPFEYQVQVLSSGKICRIDNDKLLFRFPRFRRASRIPVISDQVLFLSQIIVGTFCVLTV